MEQRKHKTGYGPEISGGNKTFIATAVYVISEFSF
jgi:hypothetical protein